MQKICFMLTDENNRKFFVGTKRKKIIQDFVKNYGVKLNLVKTNKNNIKSIDEIVVLFCDQNYHGSGIEYSIIAEQKGCESKSSKQKSIEIREKIEKTFIQKKQTTFAEIQKVFKKENISLSSLSNYFAQVRKHLSIKGVCITKIKRGTYIIND